MTKKSKFQTREIQSHVADEIRTMRYIKNHSNPPVSCTPVYAPNVTTNNVKLQAKDDRVRVLRFDA